MKPETIRSAIAHAIAEYPKESCGYVLSVQGLEVYYPCENESQHPYSEFKIGGGQFIAASEEGEIIAMVHSHPNASAKATQPDIVACEASGVPWYIVSVFSDGAREVASVSPTGYRAPYIGREYLLGVLDCYTICKDWYKWEHGIILPDIEYEDEWWNDGKSNLYLDNFEKAGFYRLPQNSTFQIGDAVLMQIRSRNDVPNHAGILLENSLMLHHPYGKLSRRDVYGGMWAQYTRMILRHNRFRSSNVSS